MNNKTWQQISTAVLTTVFGINGLILISPVKANAHKVIEKSTSETKDTNTISRSLNQPFKDAVTTNIYQHQGNNQDAATVYFQNSPFQEVKGKPQPKPQITAKVKHHTTRTYTGKASWYGPGFHGRRTANGERFNQNAYTAAHRSLPFGTKVRVTNLNNGRSVTVRINDRGPFIRGRIIDLAAGAAKAIGLYSSGVAPVRIQVLGR